MGKQYKAQQFIDAIPNSGGIISTVARKIGCSWDTVKRAIDDYPTVKTAYDNECEQGLDVAHSVVLGNVQAAAKQQRESGYTMQVDSTDAKWYLSRKGKWSERQEVTGVDGGEILIRLDR